MPWLWAVAAHAPGPRRPAPAGAAAEPWREPAAGSAALRGAGRGAAAAAAMSAWRGSRCGSLCLGGRAAARRSALLRQRAGTGTGTGTGPCSGNGGGVRAGAGGFRPSRVAVVAKTTRYEFEQQRYRYAGLSEDDLRQLVRRDGVCGVCVGVCEPLAVSLGPLQPTVG